MAKRKYKRLHYEDRQTISGKLWVQIPHGTLRSRHGEPAAEGSRLIAAICIPWKNSGGHTSQKVCGRSTGFQLLFNAKSSPHGKTKRQNRRAAHMERQRAPPKGREAKNGSRGIDSRGRMINKMSWAFSVAEESYDRETHTRTILKIKKVYDVSAVSIPANGDTEISARAFASRSYEQERQELLKRRAAILKIRASL